MKTKHIFLLALVFTYILSNAQCIKNGVYKNPYGDGSDNDIICINNDTITICFSNYKSCFRGAYQLKGNQICLSENTLLGKNAIIIKEKCSPDSIELRLITKHKHYLIGMPSNDTNIYEYESNIYTMLINETPLISKDTSGIYIYKGQFSDEALSNGFWLQDASAQFTDYFSFPLKYGTRYIINHKYYEFRPSLIYREYTPSYIYLYDNNNSRIIIKNNFQDEHYEIHEFKNDNCDSCFNELKNRFPLLFE